ncbi:hypothetical protein M2454_001436 [Aequitasia blattaphilus]|uniref:GHKL domain-containing protein n=1 Tax=Aequitasia blattaphilus TaxID=2949332 RepID=A0ABT1EBY4_9FIRM|nr:sensor histidine kinase [Aequitasia blattaphilus]MCP1103348.1 GHKL domain-containing protein [Aequitasia blattaphilus]MCR8615988.1 GHKL domain-containing protein [Aequitasia blattaphilus]
MSSLLSAVIIDIVSTAFEVITLLIFLSNEKVKGSIRRVFYFFVCIGITVVLSFFDVNLMIKMVIIVASYACIGVFVFECKWIKLAVYNIIYMFLLYISQIFVVQVWNNFNEPIFSDNAIYEDYSLTVNLLVHATHFTIMYTLKPFMKKSMKKINLREILLIPIVTIPFMITLFAIHISLPAVHDTKSADLFILCSICIFLAFVSLVIFLQNYTKMQERQRIEAQENDHLKLKNEYYLKRLLAEEKIKEVYHDLKNHFLLSDKNEISEKTKKLLNSYENYYDTGNEFLDIILADKIAKASKYEIRLEIKADFYHGEFIDPLDISSIFGNLLDNAIEATKKVQMEKRIIYFEVNTKGEMLSIVIKNSMTLSKEYELLATEKKNKRLHGLGIMNVRETLKKYGAVLALATEGKFFIASAIIPVKNVRRKYHEEGLS